MNMRDVPAGAMPPTLPNGEAGPADAGWADAGWADAGLAGVGLTHAGLASLADPALEPLFWRAERVGATSAWWRHVPFAHWIVCAAQPAVLVELGTHAGVSYSAFCQAVQRTGLPTRCHAVDTWQGDEHAGRYEDAVFDEFRSYHDAHFSRFSTLIRSTFDDALGQLEAGSIDLLHI